MQTLTEKLLTYALGRGSDVRRHAGRPRDRARRARAGLPLLVRWCSASSTSVPFQMRVKVADAAGVPNVIDEAGADMFITKTVVAAADVSAGHGRRARAAAPRRDDAGGDRAREARAAQPRRARRSSTCRTAPTWRRGRRPRPARSSSSRRPSKPLEPFRDSLVVVSNLQARRRTVAEMHAAAASGWLSGATPKAHRRRGLPRRHDDRPGDGASRSARRRRFRRSSSRPRTSPATSAPARPATAAPT